MSPPRGKEGSSRWSSCAYVTMGREKGVRGFLFFFSWGGIFEACGRGRGTKQRRVGTAYSKTERPSLFSPPSCSDEHVQ